LRRRGGGGQRIIEWIGDEGLARGYREPYREQMKKKSGWRSGEGLKCRSDKANTLEGRKHTSRARRKRAGRGTNPDCFGTAGGRGEFVLRQDLRLKERPRHVT